MGDRIEFPLNGRIYFQKGVAAFEQGKQNQAIKYLTKAVEYTDNTEVNLYCAFALSVYRKYQEALAIMNEKKDFYTNSENHASFYAEMLIKNNQFLEAEYIIQKYQLDPTTAHDQVWEKLEHELNEMREVYNLEEKMKRKDIIQSLRLLANYAPMVQAQKVENARQLELRDLQEIAPLILSNHQLNENTRRGYLELLIRHKDENTYPFLWLNKLRTVRPVDLPEFSEIELVKSLLNLLEEKLSKHPDLYYWIEAEVLHDLLLLYPYIDEIVTDPDFWIDLYIMDLDLFHHVKKERLAVTDEQIKMKETLDYLHIVAQRNQILHDK